MKLHISKYTDAASKADLLALPIFVGEKLTGPAATVDGVLNGQISRLLREEIFTGKSLTRQLLLPHPLRGFRRLILIGMGKRDELNTDQLRRFGGAIAQAAAGQVARIAVIIPDSAVDRAAGAQAIVEGVILGGYDDSRFRSPQPERITLRTLSLLSTGRNLAAIKAGADRGLLIATLQNRCRDLSGTPSNILTPRALAEQARRIAREYGLRIQVLSRGQIAKLKMGAFLAVANGSTEPPFLIKLEYKSRRAANKRISLVGKGITFDSGGISIKPAENMHEMRQDMTGAAVVLTAVAAAAKLKLPIAITAWIPTCENMPSATAYKPGDVLTTSIGKTIEIINTDAEGRLLLADVLGHAAKSKPDHLIDVATLTGAVTIALGHHGAAMLSTSDQLVEVFTAASRASGEKLWRLPLWEENEAYVKSNIADMTNSGGRPAGTITAALILKRFTADISWLHLDIAGVDYQYVANEITPKGPSGFGVRVLIEALSRLAQ